MTPIPVFELIVDKELGIDLRFRTHCTFVFIVKSDFSKIAEQYWWKTPRDLFSAPKIVNLRAIVFLEEYRAIYILLQYFYYSGKS